MVNAARFIAVALALLMAAEAPAQMKGKRGGKGGQRESVDLYHVTAEELHSDLKLAPAQEPLWDAYVGKIEALKGDIARDRARKAEGRSVATRELDRLVDVQRDRLTAMEDIAEAGRELYKSLDAEQKVLADARLAKLVAAAMNATSFPSSSRPSSPGRPPD
jgi:hypothetical protein